MDVPVRPRCRPWGWFLAWLTVGAASCVGVLSFAVGLLVLPFALAAAALLAWRSHGLGATGALSGVGLPLLYVAYLNRGGPGNVCTSAPAGAESCLQEWSPWPWLAAAIVLVGLGLAAFVLRHRRH